jgi:hypothetical protein
MLGPIVEEVEEEFEESGKQLLLLFRLTVRRRPGKSIFDQVVDVAKDALLSGHFRQGQPFPSVRALAAGLGIHRNTAHTIVKHLVNRGWRRVWCCEIIAIRVPTP